MDDQQSLIKVVIHLADKTLLKGHVDNSSGIWSGHNAVEADPFPGQVELRLLDGRTATIELSQAKAVFFVNAFAGQPKYKELSFFKNVPEFPGLWVRLRFADQEVTEGLVRNSLGMLVQTGLFLKPPDPSSNNRMVYALKRHLLNFEILGLRSEY
jgi:hypothetical protein